MKYKQLRIAMLKKGLTFNQIAADMKPPRHRSTVRNLCVQFPQKRNQYVEQAVADALKLPRAIVFPEPKRKARA